MTKIQVTTIFTILLSACSTNIPGYEVDNGVLALEWDYVTVSAREHHVNENVTMDDWTLNYATIEEISELCESASSGCTEYPGLFGSTAVIIPAPPEEDNNCAIDPRYGSWAYNAMHEMLHAYGLEEHDELFFSVLDGAYLEYVKNECPELKWW